MYWRVCYRDFGGFISSKYLYILCKKWKTPKRVSMQFQFPACLPPVSGEFVVAFGAKICSIWIFHLWLITFGYYSESIRCLCSTNMLLKFIRIHCSMSHQSFSYLLSFNDRVNIDIKVNIAIFYLSMFTVNIDILSDCRWQISSNKHKICHSLKGSCCLIVCDHFGQRQKSLIIKETKNCSINSGASFPFLQFSFT